MRIDIKPQWRKLANWYWDTLEGKAIFNSGMSIWEMLEAEYGAKKGYSNDQIMWCHFPDEKSYTAFLLRWA